MLNAVMSDSLFRCEDTSERTCSIQVEMDKEILTAQLKQIAIRRKENSLQYIGLSHVICIHHYKSYVLKFANHTSSSASTKIEA